MKHYTLIISKDRKINSVIGWETPSEFIESLESIYFRDNHEDFTKELTECLFVPVEEIGARLVALLFAGKNDFCYDFND